MYRKKYVQQGQYSELPTLPTPRPLVQGGMGAFAARTGCGSGSETPLALRAERLLLAVCTRAKCCVSESGGDLKERGVGNCGGVGDSVRKF